MATDRDTALNRRDRNDYYLGIARSISFGSKCPEGKQHGCVAVLHSRIVSQGYNGPPAGEEHCEPCYLEEYKREHGRKAFDICPAVHAEVNCIITAATVGTAIVDAVFYVTKEPCKQCLAVLQNMGLAGVIYLDDMTGDHMMLAGPRLKEKMRLDYGERQ